jgi:beta-glucosidase
MTVDIEGLLGKLTLEEQISLLAGANIWETVPIERLDIPALKVFLSSGYTLCEKSAANAGI